MNETIKKNKFSLLIFIGIVTLFTLGYIIITNSKHVGKTCGGITANLPEFQCPIGLNCVSENSYPDAGGNCQYLWSPSLTNQ